jgi:hypothetical protein
MWLAVAVGDLDARIFTNFARVSGSNSTKMLMLIVT